jgi:hypothetical protein
VLFHTVRLQPSDSAKALAALGLKLKRKRGQILLQQPCPAFQCSLCSIYAARPERCRRFECRQLLRVAAGTITEAAARENILGAKRRVAELESLLARTGGFNPKRPLSRRCEQRLAELPAGAADGETEEVMAWLRQRVRELDALLNEDFRIVPKAAEAGAGDGWPGTEPFGEPPKAAGVPDGTGDRAVPFYAAPDHRPPPAT